MKGFSASLGMKRCKDLDHKIRPPKYPTSSRPVPPDSLEHRVPHSTLNCHRDSPVGVHLQVNTCSSAGFNLHRGGRQNALVVQLLAMLLAGANL